VTHFGRILHAHLTAGRHNYFIAAGYNIVAYNSRFFGLPQSLGPLDLEQEDPCQRPGVIIASDMQELETHIDARCVV
jgi:hypothetical protein